MGCCEVKSDKFLKYELDLNIHPQESSFNEISLSSEEFRATTHPNQLNWVIQTPNDKIRPRSTSCSCNNRIEMAFLLNSPAFTRNSEATKSVLVPCSENSLELGVIKEEDKDVTVSFDDNRV